MFTRKTLVFLKELSENNNRDWFADNKQRYEDEVRTPALEYIDNMAVPLSRISPHFVASAKKTGGSLMRVYRDTRFGKDKTPYKTNVGIQFRHARGKDVHAPGFYLHLEPGSLFLAAGIWRPESTTLKAVRSLMDENQSEWQALTNKLIAKDKFEFGGDSLKRPPRGFNEDHPLINDLKRKDLIAIKPLKATDILGKNLVKESTALFKKVTPLVKFICEADDLDY